MATRNSSLSGSIVSNTNSTSHSCKLSNLTKCSVLKLNPSSPLALNSSATSTLTSVDLAEASDGTRKNRVASSTGKKYSGYTQQELNRLLTAQQQMKRLQHRPVAPIPRKHWLFIRSGVAPMQLQDLSGTAPSIFEEDDGMIVEKLREMRKKKGMDKGDPNDTNLPFWERRKRNRNGDWKISDPKVMEDVVHHQELAVQASQVSVSVNTKTDGLHASAVNGSPGGKASSNAGRIQCDALTLQTDSPMLPYPEDSALVAQPLVPVISNSKVDIRPLTQVLSHHHSTTIPFTIRKHSPSKAVRSLLSHSSGADATRPSPLVSNYSFSHDAPSSSTSSPSQDGHRHTDIHSDSESPQAEERSLESTPTGELALTPSSFAEAPDYRHKQKSSRSSESRSSPGEIIDSGENLISQLKQQAIAMQNTGVDPHLVSSLKDSLSYYPGIERRERRAELMAFDRTFEDVLTSGQITVENLNLMIKAKALQGDIEAARRLHDQMKLHGFEPNADTYVALLQGATVHKDANMARMLYLKMRSQLIAPTSRVYAALIKAHVAASDINAGFALLRKMEDERIPVECVTYTTLIDGLVKSNRIEKAWKVFGEIRTWKAIQPDEVLFTVMIKACAKRREAEKAINMLGDMRTCGLYPTDVTYTELIHACSTRSDFFQQCFDFYAQMKAEDMPVGPFAYERLLTACSSTGNIKKAKHVLKDMTKSNVSVTASTYTIIINVFATAMKLAKVTDHERLCNLRYAWEAVQDMRHKQLPIDTTALNALTQVYINAGLAQYAIDMLKQFELFKCEPNRHTFEALLQMLGKNLKDSGRFFALWEFMKANTLITVSPRMMHLALDTAMTSRSASRVVKVLQEMYEAKVYPTPQLTDRLARVGRQVTEIHALVGMFIKMQKEDTFHECRKQQSMIQSKIDEHELRLFADGKTPKSAATPEQEVRKQYFKKQKQKQSGRIGKWVPREAYRQLKAKGGEVYALHHDKVKPTMISSR
eukprot:GHVQ01015867.1.p1 GENE.GHVQ01015867.1~~GHVQ01015867.1.p1  ORF type:complete len:1045 (-),score=131.46 GHVQ01015867.1:242-3211(-)